MINIPLLYYLPFALLGGMLAMWKRRFLLLTVAVLSAANLELQQSSEASVVDRNMTFSGVVIGETHYENYTKLFIRIDHVLLDKGAVEHPLFVEYYAYERGIFLGKRLVVKGYIKQSRSTYRMSVLTGRIISSSIPRQFFGTVFHPLRQYVDDLLKKTFRHDQYTIASGLILGGSGRMGKELKDVFGRAGVLHILAVSGLHVGFVALFFGLLLFLLPLDYRLKFIVVMLGLFVYAGVTGFRPSVCRAASMAFLFGLASVLQRNVNHIHVLNITALAFLTVRPVLIFEVGTQLSFAAVYGILFMYPKLDAVIKKRIRMRGVRLVARPMAVSLSAQIFVAPLLIHYFHRLPVYAVLANLLVVPIAAAIIFLLFACFGIGLLWYGLVEYISLPVSCLINILVAVSGFFARLPFSTIKIIVSPLLVFPLYLMVGMRMRRFVPWVLIVVASVFSIAGSCDCLTVCTVAKGMLIITPSRESVLICVQRTSAQQICLEKSGIDELDYLMAPSPCYPVKSAFISLPGQMCYKQYRLGDLEVRLSKDIVLRFRETEIACALSDLRRTGERGEYTFWLSNGKQQCVLRGSQYCTVFEQMIFDAQIVLARLKMLI
jgi:ComEC/Rec2-related protein